MKKQIVRRVMDKLPGFRKKDGHHIGQFNSDVISGYAIDAPPSITRIYRFIIPTFDMPNFLHLSLGSEIFHTSNQKNIYIPESEQEEELTPEELKSLLQHDWEVFSEVKDVESLLSYLNNEDNIGDPAKWAKFLCHVRLSQFDTAEVMLQSIYAHLRRYNATQLSLEMVLEAKDKAGWVGVQKQLEKWTEESILKYG
jgi:hypothetical protein